MQADIPQTELDSESETDFSFGDLVKEAMAHRADTIRLKEGRKIIKSGGNAPGVDMVSLLADVKRLETQREWLPRADVAMFQIQHCTACDNYAPLFTGLFQRQAHRHQRHTDRWVAATPFENKGLKKEVKTTEVDVPMCHFCYAEAGYPIEGLGISFDEDASDDVAESDLATGEEAEQLAFEALQDELAESLQTLPSTPQGA